MKYILCGGGTSGHVMPAIAIAEGLKKYDKSAEFLFVGRDNGPENKSISDKNYPLKTLEVYGIPKKITPSSVTKLFKTLKSKETAKKIIKSFQPNAIIGTGGYVAWPVIRAGAELKIPTYIHESNSVAGRVTRSLARYCERIFTGFVLCEGIRHRDKVMFTGTPVRDEFKSTDREHARKKLGIAKNEFAVFSFGGSGGAHMFNTLMKKTFEKCPDEKIRFIHASGQKYYDGLINNTDRKANVEIHPYITNIADYMASADLVISRSGALTVSELAYLGKASILIPSPNVSKNHQYKNAKLLSDLGACILLEESHLNEDILISEIMKIKSDNTLREKLMSSIKITSQKRASDIIAKEILKGAKRLSATE
jgi:UDP-N-acetylglucosamine--N-acetylmuramyl-(pentapeptide) pyrophosphoryl-undecaprenol N-acetylglucosamine transferase